MKSAPVLTCYLKCLKKLELKCIRLINLALILTAVLLTSCQKDDPQPKTGKIIFWAASASPGGASIDIMIDGENAGGITSHPTSVPACGTAGSVTLTKPPGTYTWGATGKDGSVWKGTVTVVADECVDVELTARPTTTGQMVFWRASATLGGSFIDLTFDGKNAGQITTNSGSGAPKCGTSGFITVTGQPGTYNWNAVGQDGKTWSGTTTLVANNCSTMELTGSVSSATGKAIFWVTSALGGAHIDVTVDGQNAGRITGFSSSSTPDCGTNGFVTVTKAPGTYNWNAVGQNGITWSGTVTIAANGCSKKELTSGPIGQALFWTASASLGGSFIDVTFDGQNAGRITSYFSSGAPDCGATGSVTVNKAPGTYNWSAVGQNGATWSGTATISANTCSKKELTGSTNPPGNLPPAGTAPDTQFISQECYSMNSLGAWWTQGFTLNSTRTMVLRFSSRYKADAAILTADQLSNFQNNQGFLGYGTFDDSFGYNTITLNAGSYYVGIRNQENGANVVSLELDYDITLPANDNATFNDVYINAVKSLNAGAKLWHEFTIQQGFRYFIDGNNTGLDTYIMAASEIEKFKNGQTFNAYTDYSGTNCNLPGLNEINLPAGTYFLAFRNSQSVTNSVNYFMERWRVN